MKWKRSKGRKDRDVIDIRGAEQPAGGGGGGGISLPGGVAGLGGGAGIIVVIVIIAIQAFGGGGSGTAGGFDLSSVFGTGAQAPGADDPAPIPPEQDPQRDIKEFSVYVFNDVQQTWGSIFTKDGGKDYERAQLVLYSDAVSTGGCGGATSAAGPFYCPADSRVYLDLTFYTEMSRQLGAPGDFAWAYVIAHEVGHHVQNLLGTNAEVERLTRDDPDSASELSVRTELQADCYAGVWAATVFADGDLEAGDIDEAFTATEAVGDDRLAEEAGRRVNPDTFTHGTSEQRRSWFDKGYSSGDPASCDTFSPDEI